MSDISQSAGWLLAADAGPLHGQGRPEESEIRQSSLNRMASKVSSWTLAHMKWVWAAIVTLVAIAVILVALVGSEVQNPAYVGGFQQGLMLSNLPGSSVSATAKNTCYEYSLTSSFIGNSQWMSGCEAGYRSAVRPQLPNLTGG